MPIDLKARREAIAVFFRRVASHKWILMGLLVAAFTYACVSGIGSWRTHRADDRFDKEQMASRAREAELLDRASKAEAAADARAVRVAELETLARDQVAQIDRLRAEVGQIEQSRTRARVLYEKDQAYVRSIAGDPAAVRSELRARLVELGYLEKEDR